MRESVRERRGNREVAHRERWPSIVSVLIDIKRPLSVRAENSYLRGHTHNLRLPNALGSVGGC